jgi:hypothetical protein
MLLINICLHMGKKIVKNWVSVHSETHLLMQRGRLANGRSVHVKIIASKQ